MVSNSAFKKLISGVLALSMLVAGGINSLTGFGANESVIRLSDSGAWEGDTNKMETIGTETTLNGETCVVYSGLNVANELVEFKMKPKVPGGWIGLKFRSDLPYNAPWDNQTGYLILIGNGNNIQVMRQGSLEALATVSLPSGMDLSGQTEYKITAGAINSADGNSVNIILKIDDAVVIDYSDTDTDKMSKGSGVFSIYQYGAQSNTVLSVYPNEESTLGGLIDRKAPQTNISIGMDDQWFINKSTGMGSDNGDIAQMQKTENKLVVKGKGGVSNNNSVTAEAYSFDFSMSKTEDIVSSGKFGSSIVLFRKQDRNAISGKNAYGIKFTEEGNISLVCYTNDKAKVLPAYQTGLDFTDTHKVIVEVKGYIEEDDWYSDVYIYIDSTTKAYKYRDKGYNPNLEPPGFFGVMNTDHNVTTTVSNIKHNGEMEVYQEGETSYPVYLAGVIKEGNEEFLHWEWRPDVADATFLLITTKNGKNIGKVAYPNKTFSIKDLNGAYDKLYLSTYNVEGVLSEPIEVDLAKKASDLQVDSIEKIVVDTKEGGNAGFKTEKSGKTFIPNGVNYVGIRSGDHSTFEPEYGLVPADYDPYTAEILMRTLKSNGYNFIRVFIIPGNRVSSNPGLGGIYSETQGIYIPYMECFTDFLTRANKYGIYVMPTMGENEMVGNQFFKELSNNTNGQSILFSKAGIQAKQKYLKYFLEYLKNKDPKLLDGLFGVEMQNEFAFDSTKAPFTQTSGTYTFIDGTKYDMSNDDDRRSLANAAIQNYYKEMKETIHEVDEKLLLCEGTFGMIAVNKDMESAYGMRTIKGVSDTRIPMSAQELLATDIDFLDMHIYRYGQKGTAQEIWEKYKINMLFDTDETKEYMKTKPVVMGEYAAMSSESEERELADGMKFAQELRNAVMHAGFAGTAYWTIDTFEQNDVWNLMWENGKYLNYISLLNQDGTSRDNWNSGSYLKGSK